MSKRRSTGETAAMFAAGLNCAQVVLGAWAEELGYDTEEAYRMAAAFGGGMLRGETCGAVTGALIALGLAHGGSSPDDAAQKALLSEKTREFQRRFTQRMGSTMCRELLGYDFSKDGQLQEAAASGKLMEFCPRAVCEALEILDEVM